MSKPEWEDSPKWANWLAQDSDGEWWWYAVRPSCHASHFYPPDDSKRKMAGEGFRNKKWAQTLEHRP